MSISMRVKNLPFRLHTTEFSMGMFFMIRSLSNIMKVKQSAYE